MKKLTAVLLIAALLMSLTVFAPLSASAAKATDYVYSKKVDIPFYTADGQSATYHAAFPTLKNISGSDAKAMQKAMTANYTYQQNRYQYLYDDKFSFTPKMAYTAYLYGDTLSVFICINNHDLYADSLYAYSINVKTGKRIKNADLMKTYGLSAAKVKSLTTAAIQKDLESGKSKSQKYYAKYGYDFYQKVINEIGNDNISVLFVDDKGNLMVSYYDWWKQDGGYVGYSLKAKLAGAPAAAATAYPKVTKLENVYGGVKIAWNKFSGAAKYRLFYKTSSGWKKFGTDGTATSCTINSLKSGTKYTFTVRAIGKNGKYCSSYYTKGWSITYYPAPKAVSLKTIKNGLEFQWKLVSGVKKYRVFRKVNGGAWKKLYDSTDPAHCYLQDRSVKKGNTYSYTVRCLSADGKKYLSGYDPKGKSIGY